MRHTFKLAGYAAVSLLSLAVASCGTSSEKPPEPSNDLSAQENEFKYQDQTLSIDERVDSLVDLMTLDEKIAQLYDKSPAIERLGVPRYEWWNEALHGIARAGTATVFPQAIGLAASFDENLVHEIADTISTEGRAKHEDFLSRSTRSMYTGLNFWSPNINIFRDPRWGRGQETYGEDPYLTGRIAVNFVKGLQGSHDKFLKTGATIKHYAVHSGPEPSRHSDNYTASDYDLYSTYMPAFKTVIEEANVHAIMCAYNAVDGHPACGSTHLMKDILVDEFGFNGYVVSDCGAIADFHKPDAHGYVETKAEAAAIAVKHGVDLECGDGDGSVYAHLDEAVERGLITEETITTSVKRLFKARFRLGLFDREFIYRDNPIELVGSEKHLDLTYQAAKKAMVLLKNDGVLPLKENQKIALIGPNADNFDILIANYYGQPVNPSTPYQALKEEFRENLSYAPGSALAGDMYAHYQAVSDLELFVKEGDNFVNGVDVRYSKLNAQEIARSERLNNVNHKWQLSPISNIDDENFSANFSGFISPKESGNYRFSGNVQLTIAGNKVTDTVELQAGEHYPFSADFISEDAWHSNAIQPSAKLTWLRDDIDLTQQALDAAKNADIIVFMGGISASLEGEEMSVNVDGFLGGDRTHIKIPATQMAVIEKLTETDKPLVYVNFSGSAIDLSWMKENANAIVQGFYPGEATGPAIRDLLLGRYSPSARLPVTFYESISGLPGFKDYSMTNRTHRYFTGEPVYRFGEGMGYANIKSTLGDVPENHANDADLDIQVKLSNTSSIDGEEVVQLYVEPSSGQSPEQQALKTFTSIKVAAGQTVNATLSIPREELYFIGDHGEQVPYSGEVTFRLGFDPADSAQRFTTTFSNQ